ncbi:histidine kinase [Lentinula edodes]|uniref:histidine kinase n=1 Tax=Lentinula edodes TaxID=5353 RepID=A0A1Q3EMF2_LENED|nr:histidine kinase [Lentinula edodes]
MPHGHCQVCLGYFALSDFQVLPCARSWWLQVLPWQNIRHNSKVANFQNTIEGLERMDASVPSISVTRASTRIKRTVDDINCDNEIAVSLRQAIADFDDRIVPVFIRVEAQAKEVEQLQKQLTCAQRKAKTFDDVCESSEKKDALIIALRSELDRSSKEGRQAVSVKESLTADYLASKRQNELDTEEKNRLEHDNRDLRRLLECHAKSAQSRKDKIQALKHEITKLKQRNETLEETQSSVLEETLSTLPFNDYVDKSYRSSRLSQVPNELSEPEVDINFDSGMPGPGFSSDWKMSSTTKSTKRKAASLNFPIPLDKRGRPTVSVQTGPTTNIFRRVQKTLAAPSSSTVVRESLEGIQHALDNNRYALEEDQAVKVEEVNEDEVVEEVVVDRAWNEASTKTSLKSKALSESDGGEVCSESPASIPGIQDPMKRPALLIVFWTLYSHWQQFFNPRFKDINKEIHYQKENWAHSKRLSLWASVFFIGNWILGAALIPTPAVLLDKIYYYGFAPCTAVPLVLLCAFNLPRDHTRFYQCFLFISTWSWSYYQVLFGFLCGYSGRNDLFTCGSKDFSSTFYYTTALQTVALFGLDLKRFPALLGAIIFIVLSGFLIIPEKVKYVSLINRDLVGQSEDRPRIAGCEIFLMYMHYQREMSARHLFALRIELKEQFERTQKAQINERKAADSKYRLTSYVRVPLNTALLAVQNMSASGTIVKSLELEFTALEGSLSMMSKVLNDVLDFNRMDSGKFESLSRPYAFHHVMRSMLLPLRLATDARKLELVTDLDMNIDEVARRAAYEALGEDRETIDKHMKEQPSGESHFGIVVGDETRLRQIVTNLASNACKFTPAGGKVIIRTRLILPSSPSLPHNEENEQNSIQDESLTTQNVEKHDEENNPENISRIVVRIEVSDTGSGIKPQDMAQSKLFSAFNQTEQGRQQGGKGTGLGLALVRLIVKLSGGRLGVRSRVEEGSTFWVELPLGIGVKAMLIADENNVFSSPARNLSSNTLRQLIKSKSRSNSTQSKTSIIEAVDAAAQRATQASPMTLRSNNALHRLMDQGGSVELNLANHED